MGKVKNGVPDRWYNYKSLGSVIEGTRIIAFKVPLQFAQIDKNTEEDYRLNVDKLIKKLPNLGVVIDLTNTSRYYNPTELEKNGVIHAKIFVPGHVIPRSDLRNSFRSYVKSFLEENKDNDKIIGVHCTHGVNRTGFMICDYLVHELKMHPLEAIKVFEAARKHPIERENYRDFLMGKGGDNLEEEKPAGLWRKSHFDYNEEVSRKPLLIETRDRDDSQRIQERERYQSRQDNFARREYSHDNRRDRDNWRPDRSTGRSDRSFRPYGRGPSSSGSRPTERRDFYEDRNNTFNRRARSPARSESPQIGAPRIPRTPSPHGRDSAPRSRHCQPRGRGYYKMVIPQQRRISRHHLTGSGPDARGHSGNPFK
ncbi:DUSP11 family protein [Megaselia abdita]